MCGRCIGIAVTYLMGVTSIDERYMGYALREAERSLAESNLPVGAAIVHRGKLIATGRNRNDTRHTHLTHAEMEAMRACEAYLYAHKQECELYTTLEPCMMCLGAIINFRFRRLVIAAPDRSYGALGLLGSSAPYMARAPEIRVGVLAETSQALLAAYVARTGLSRHFGQGEA